MKNESSRTHFWVMCVSITALIFSVIPSFYSVLPNSDEISVKRINIVDDHGNNVLVLTNKDLVPPPILNGQTFKRAVNPGGIIFYDEQGNECGGIALSQNDEVGLSAIVLDYNSMDAIGLMVQEDHEPEGEYLAGLMINDRASPGKVGDGKNRVRLENANGVARLVFKDSDGTDRLILGVDNLGEAFFDLLDEDGEKTRSLIND